jgi:hypothetical protein
MYRYKMTSVFGVLSNEETMAEDLLKATDQKNRSAIQTKKQDEPTSRKYFMICQTCFWCASYFELMDMVLPYKVCPTCNHTAVELLPLSDNEHYHFKEYRNSRGYFGIYIKKSHQ